ncbi:TlyA family RNA methyltransferase [Amnibacterium endophyticum]|uniref:TlyA family RNA methyltransferase n=1 Tax=Amnibacterium endophyticum TaxID=2109337 RepID=A0ABW4LBF2_9MICO
MTSRLDVALVERGLARSRTAAAAAIAAGRVRVDGRAEGRPSRRVSDEDEVLVEPDAGWVGRAAGKLDAALEAFGVQVGGKDALDLGASTGGFTQVLLRRGAARVVALDVGHDQLVPELRDDARVVVVEGENARTLTAARLAALTGSDEPPGVVVADLSFISLRLVLPEIAAVAAADADVVLLVKPQFEVGRSRVHGGVVTDPADREEAVRGVLDAAAAVGLRTAGVVGSTVSGQEGNREVLVHLHAARGSDPAEWDQILRQVVRGPREAG